jgi:hypothetical protein
MASAAVPKDQQVFTTLGQCRQCKACSSFKIKTSQSEKNPDRDFYYCVGCDQFHKWVTAKKGDWGGGTKVKRERADVEMNTGEGPKESQPMNQAQLDRMEESLLKMEAILKQISSRMIEERESQKSKKPKSESEDQNNTLISGLFGSDQPLIPLPPPCQNNSNPS